MKKAVLIAAGCILLALGVVGIAVPLLPTTPFLLAAAACFFRSSDFLYQWMTHHRLFGVYLRSYRQFHAVSLRTKVAALALLWVTIGTSALFFVTALYLRILLTAIAAAVTMHILKLRTLTAEMRKMLK